MEAIKRLELEIRKHRLSITDSQKELEHEKSEFRRRIKAIDSDVNGENDAHNYGLVYEYADRICNHIRAIKELQQLIIMKTNIHLENSQP